MNLLNSHVTRGAGLAAFAVLAACADLMAPAPVSAPVVPGDALAVVACEVTVASGTVRCGAPGASASGASATIIGGQGTNVVLAATGVAYTSADSIFAFNTTIQNLMDEKMGTDDGVNPHAEGIRVFFAGGPSVTGGTGSISVENADSVGTFTGASQPYFQYDEVLATDQVSAPRTWRLKVDPSVTSFSFFVYVATKLEPLLIINELMANPGGTVQDSTGEYVEVYNAGRFPIEMSGMILNDGSGSGIGGVDTIHTSLIVPPGGYRVLGRTQNTARNGGITVDYSYTQRLGGTTTLLQFSNSAGDHFRIRSATGVTIDSVAYANAPTAAVAGVARELINPGSDNLLVDGASWGAATSNYEAANKGTPGAVNSVFTP